MLAVVYLIFSIFMGYIFINVFTPYIFKPKNLYMHFTSSTRLFPQLFVVFPASFTIGVILSGWLLYIPSYFIRTTEPSLFCGSITAFAVMIFISVIYLIFKRSFIRDLGRIVTDFTETMKHNIPLAVFFIFVLIYTIWLMTLTFFVKDGNIRIGTSVFSDFSVHTAIIRSFSYGNNFPTQFPHFPDGTIRYHFMFQFYTGALEYMGLRIDAAFNLMSIISLFNATLLLYVIAVIVTNKRGAGILTVIFFVFRSSFSGLKYLAENWPYKNFSQFINLIIGNTGFIGYSSNEERWGLWNMNVYANQRHFALGISLLLFGLLAMLPLMKKMYYVYEYRSLTLKDRLKQFFFTADAWLPGKLTRAIPLGILFGAAAFFHGSAVIALLSMLAIMGLFSKHRLEFLIIAVITYVMSNCEAAFFAPGIKLAEPHLVFGFISPDKSVKGIALYIIMLTGIALAVALFGLFMRFKRFKVFFLMFLIPFIITFSFSLTPDVTVNHKFLMISIALLNIFAAYAICVMMGKIPGKIIGIVLAALMVITGIIDVFTVQNLNSKDKHGNLLSVSIPLKSSYQDWLINNTKPDDIFFTTWDGVNELFFTGRYEFFGWPYYAWSSGYDTYGRKYIYEQIASPESAESCKRLVNENKISYIVLSRGFYEKMDDFFPNPELLKTIFPIVYNDQEKELCVLKTDYTP